MTNESAVSYIQLTGNVFHGEPDEGGFVSYCPALDIASQGETRDEAVENLADALVEFISLLASEGRLQMFLAERDIPLLDHEPRGEERKQTVTATTGSLVSLMVASMQGGQVAIAI